MVQKLDGGKYQEIGKNRNENAKADECCQITRQNHKCRLVEQIWHLCIGDVVRSSRLCWFEYVERKPEEDGVKKALTFEVDGIRLSGRPKNRMNASNKK